MSETIGRTLINEGMELYRQGAAQRATKNGVNTSLESIDKFKAAHKKWSDMSSDDRLTALEQAEACHHSGSAAAPGNANLAKTQGNCNLRALEMLDRIPPHSRSSEWQRLHDKINAGLMENGHKPFNSREFRQIVKRQLEGGLKDGPGRAAFLINKLKEAGKITAAKHLAIIAKAHLEREGTNFADNQVARLEEVIAEVLEAEDDTDEGADEEDNSDEDHPGAPSTGPPVLTTGFHFLRLGNRTFNTQYSLVPIESYISIMKTKQPYTIIAALDSENGIARDGSIPWNLPGDLAHFRTTTSTEYTSGNRNALIIGRITWDSIPTTAKPGFANRDIIILTHAPDYAVSSTFSPSATPESEEAAHISTAASIDEAFTRAELGNYGHIFIVGGEQIYEQTIARPEITQLILTRVDGNFDCDQFFPHLPNSFTQITVEGPFNDSPTPYSIHTYEKA